jgi:hypothetical protein
MSGVALLDVNVLVALFDPDHVHHELAHDWFADHRSAGWATCPVTENGFLRVLSNPAYGRDALRPDRLVERLRKFRASGDHVFWTDSVSLSDGRFFNLALAPGFRQVTDVYLLGLARKMQGCLATFERAIPVRAVIGATRSNLQIIGPSGED